MEAADSWIDRVEFPTTKIELIDAAAGADAPQEMVERLQALAREQYESREQVEAELGG
jgi:hypothetical protein